MKKRLIIGAVVAAIVVGLGVGSKKVYIEAEVKGCEKTVLYDIEQHYGEIPDDVKAKIVTQLDTECRKIL